jgi:HTH-type transcriptional regulator/antitoxin HigA
MNTLPILTELDYEAALHEAAVYFDFPPVAGSSEAERFVRLLTLIEDYEAVHYPIATLEPASQAANR